MIGDILRRVEGGGRLDANDAIRLFETSDIFSVGRAAAAAAMRHNGDRAYYVRNVHVNPTNICVNRCRFCAFSRTRGEEGAYEMAPEAVLDRIREAGPVTELHLVGGLHPDWTLGYYEDLLRAIRREFPALHIKAFTAVEVEYLARRAGLGLSQTIERLRDAGLGSMPGGGAEIFSARVRDGLCPEKIGGRRWLEVMEAAHAGGIRTNATMLYGHLETIEERVEHLLMLRELQDRTNGFQAFIPLSYHPGNTEIGGSGPSGLDDLMTVAVSRLMLDNFPHIKAYWVMLGEKLSQLALLFGADDLDGTVIEERITHATGETSGKGITVERLRHLIASAGKRPVERDSFYREAGRANG